MSTDEKRNALGFQIYFTGMLARNNFNDFLKPYDIFTEQYGVLCVLNEHTKLTLRQISEEMFKDKTTITRLIDSLVKKDFIKKTPSDTDRRAFNVTLTSKGALLYDEIGLCLKEAKQIMEDKIDPKEKEITLKVLAQFREMNITDEVNKLKKDKEC